MGLSFYIPVSFGYGVDEFTISVSYEPFYMTAIFNFITWFIPMVVNAVFALQVLYLLSIRQKKRDHLSHTTQTITAKETTDMKTATNTLNKTKKKFSFKNFKVSPIARFQIIIFSYWFQWIGKVKY